MDIVSDRDEITAEGKAYRDKSLEDGLVGERDPSFRSPFIRQTGLVRELVRVMRSYINTR